jgi:hypothetical protein
MKITSLRAIGIAGAVAAALAAALALGACDINGFKSEIKAKVESASGPRMALDSSSLAFTAVVNGSDPAGQAISITNAGAGSLTDLSATVSYSNGSGWITGSIDTTTAPATMTVYASPAGLSAGNYSATISITSASASNSPRTVAVTLEVLEGATLKVINNTTDSIYYLYISPVTSSDWGPDLLGSGTIAAGATYYIYNIPPGYYDLKAESSGNVVIETVSNYYFQDNSTITWTVVGAKGLSPNPAPALGGAKKAAR